MPTLALAFALILLPQGHATSLKYPTPGTFSATAICEADHPACAGRASLYLPADHGPYEVAGCSVRAGERFELSAEDALVAQRLLDMLLVEVTLEGHAPATARASAISEGCDLGLWRIPVEDARSDLSLPALPTTPSSRTLRLELRGGDPRDAIVDFLIPDHTTPPRMCGLAYTDIRSGDQGLRRVDRRTWEIDLDRVGEKADHFPIFISTRSGTRLPPTIDWASSKEKLPAVLRFTAPVRLGFAGGRVVDAAGSPVVGARVVAFNDQSSPRSVASSADGRFSFGELGLGQWWIRVNDERWRSRGLYGTSVQVIEGPEVTLNLVVDRQRWIEINPTQLSLGEEVGALLAVKNNPNARFPTEPDWTLSLRPDDLAAPFRIPACWGDEFELSIVATPPEGLPHDGELGPWIRDRRVACATVAFPNAQKPGVTRFVALRR